MSTTQTAVTSTLVNNKGRMLFLPRYFGNKLMIRGENLVYRWMDKLSDDYNGGMWSFYTLSNGGYYMAPATDQKLNVACEGNEFEGAMSADAAGIVANLYALCSLSELDEFFCERYYCLRDFAIEHAESNLILGAID